MVTRLHLVLEPTALLRVLDRLAVLDLLPNALCFRRPEAGNAVLQLEWDEIDESKAVNLRDRLAQFPAVCMVDFIEQCPDSPLGCPMDCRTAGGGTIRRELAEDCSRQAAY